MAKTTAPLLSFGASGAIAKTQVYSKWRGIDYARRYVVPANPNTVGQQSTRDTFKLLSAMWVGAGPLLRAPWALFATGQPFTDRNAFMGRNIEVLRGEADMQNFIGSPGAKGGLPPSSIAAAAGVGQITVTFTNPAAPTGWTLVAAQAACFVDQDPETPWAGTLTEAEDTAAPMDTVVLDGGLPTSLHVVVGWLQWTKANGDTAYGASLIDTATPT